MDKDEKIIKGVVETYSGDMAEVLASDTGGLVKKVIRGEEESQAEKINSSPLSGRNRFFLLAGSALLLIGVGTLGYFLLQNKNNTVPVEEHFTPLIFTDQSAFLEVGGFEKDAVAQTVRNEINTTKVKAGGLEGIYLTENKQNIVGLRRLIALIEGSFLPGNDTNLVSDNFLMGAANNSTPTGATPGFFMLIKTRSTADIFDSLRAWEPKILNDLHGFLGIHLDSDTHYLLTKDFEDGVVQNKNARILKDKDGKLVVMYIFADDNSVIITDSETAADEVMLRLSAAQSKK
jgi:hypothetical protein